MISTGWAEAVVEFPKTVWELKEGDRYIHLVNYGGKARVGWEDTTLDESRRGYNNCFLTEEEADMELLRRESRAKAWKPEEGEVFWAIDSKGRTYASIWEGDYIDIMYFHNGHTHKTKEEAIEWGEKYGKAF